MLDTNAVSNLIRGQGNTALQALVIERDACISVITEAEIRFGVKRKPQATRLAKAVGVFLLDMPCLPWTSATAQTYADLRTRMEVQGIGLSAMDLLIAAHAIAEDCTLISADGAFTKVPGLRVLDWSANDDSTLPGNPARLVRERLAREGISPSDVADAVAEVRASAKQVKPKKPAKPE
ncbi:MAG: type II toxin-antitoxin system VapC family toxin [Thiobacillus sp.]|nr:type II toxin-antitoxin system VapC family toxin [Thiobacillus sp.]